MQSDTIAAVITFQLPDELIAQFPVNPRDSAKLLVYDRKSKTIVDTFFSELDDYLPANSTIVLNNSKVEHCRWLFDNLEIFVLSKHGKNQVRALVRPGKKFNFGKELILSGNITAKVDAIDQDGIRTLTLNVPHDSPALKKYEHVPLPPYIKQDDSLAEEYQTVYAKTEGSKAAPTAGLHFTPELLSKLRETHNIAEITLHVGLGTFAPLNEEQIKAGKLHSEWYSIDNKNIHLLAKSDHITAVGTTSTRTLESIESLSENTSSGWTDILISPGYKFKHVNSLITNFHLPGTSLLLLVEAFVGSEDKLQKIYDHAINNKYRFYSFGDAMLII